ncbi:MULTISPECIES: acetyl-CoA C-acyltransferase [Chryseobacterium]|jgi:acetyl-CoA C-acetyltransferase|uniref:acetyl-CoA C-acetyltransferase n=1 Tax=Chryseobacterium indoltheticum TaxID=254 RepID=A0A381FGN4_9FLAO|nr:MULTISPECIES: acetyl-CoA C-acyltransferase [Chryseobacterium]AZA59714.1 acetyl-CoA C-acyltransferase [Chryseobacterium indoltheticum]AZA74622.1 acetyl-CoA C-acyltransferase [Chryseobacterium indoltheticum]MDF2832715.1 acetyl-CoA C-acyltransferase [Chryseobacterium indoltheticum]MDQ8140891.1 acetyl-CoA C-acyltransferase [Chryseobacterium sp. CFS15]SIQ10686.1 acetyl-CoA C-acetyltransferase [Chryseobacterium indoltheticum]
MKEVFIVSAVRTPIGSFMGSLSTVPATKLGTAAVKGALDKINLDPKNVQEIYMGNVLQAGEGQAPARQVALGAGLSNETPSTTINKVCASGMKAVSMAAQAIKAGDADVIIAGGMENMSMVPHYYNARNATKLGDVKMQDGMVLDGLTDVYNKVHMGVCAEKCATDYSFTREDQDNFAIQSYKRSAKAWSEGKFAEEVVPVSIPQRKGDPVIFAEDEEYKAVNFDRLPTLPTVFKKEEGTVTAANASTLNDGASALILVSKEKMEELGLKPLAKIVSYADAAQEPENFTTAPAKALPIALKKAGLEISDIDFFEFNEAFSVVGLANNKILGLDAAKVNVNGGAVALGHPLGSSGSRIIVTLINVLKQNNAKYGAAAICNGGGGASAIVIENM